MDARYMRNIPALTEKECLLLKEKRILVVGCGGLGGHIIDMLARIGIGCLRVVDGDVFDATNLNRQLLSQVSLLGTSKAKAAAEHITRINPDIVVEVFDEFMTEANVQTLISGCDIVMDALDNVAGRRILAAACETANIPYVYGTGVLDGVFVFRHQIRIAGLPDSGDLHLFHTSSFFATTNHVVPWPSAPGR